MREEGSGWGQEKESEQRKGKKTEERKRVADGGTKRKERKLSEKRRGAK